MEPHAARIWELLEQTQVGMLTTRFAEGLRARPLEARPDREAGVIYFIIDRRGLKDDEIEACADVCFTLTNDKEKAYLSITGTGAMLKDELLAARHWKKTDDVWWPQGPRDPNVLVLRLEPHIGELWDGPASTDVARHEFARARATGQKPNLGEKRKVTVRLV